MEELRIPMTGPDWFECHVRLNDTDDTEALSKVRHLRSRNVAVVPSSLERESPRELQC